MTHERVWQFKYVIQERDAATGVWERGGPNKDANDEGWSLVDRLEWCDKENAENHSNPMSRLYRVVDSETGEVMTYR